MIKTYSELITLPTFKDRFDYLQINGSVGEETFGSERYLNQMFYKTKEWKDLRKYIITRDGGCDLGVEGYDIYGKILIHHLNPITAKDVINRNEDILDPENLICVSYNTHNAIHYSDETLLITEPKKRSKNDTCPWKW